MEWPSPRMTHCPNRKKVKEKNWTELEGRNNIASNKRKKASERRKKKRYRVASESATFCNFIAWHGMPWYGMLLCCSSYPMYSITFVSSSKLWVLCAALCAKATDSHVGDGWCLKNSPNKFLQLPMFTFIHSFVRSHGMAWQRNLRTVIRTYQYMDIYDIHIHTHTHIHMHTYTCTYSWRYFCMQFVTKNDYQIYANVMCEGFS